jgi:hypothetical protein
MSVYQYIQAFKHVPNVRVHGIKLTPYCGTIRPLSTMIWAKLNLFMTFQKQRVCFLSNSCIVGESSLKLV